MLRIQRQRLKRVLGFTIAVGCLAATFLWFRGGARGPHVRGLGAVQGTESYLVKLESTTAREDGGSATFSLRGHLRLQRLAKNPVTLVGTIVDAQLTSPSASEQGAREMRDATSEFARPVRFSLDADGRITDVREDPVARKQVRHMVKTLLSVLQFVDPAHDGDSWSVTEGDTAGEYQAAYRELPSGAAAKRKVAYSSLQGISDIQLQRTATLSVVSSQSTFQFDDSGNVESLRVAEKLSGSAEHAGRFTSSTSITFVREHGNGPLPGPSEEDLRNLSRADLFAFAKSLGLSPEVDHERIAGKDIDQLMDELDSLVVGTALLDASPEEQRRSRANFASLASLFRLNAGAVDAAVERLQRGTKNPSRLWDSMAAAGSPAAQEGLRRVIEMPEWDDTQRRSQMIGLSLVSRPTQETLAFLHEKFDDPVQGQQARYGFGSAIYHLREAAPEQAAAAFGQLTDELRGARTEHDVTDLLVAVGNSGMPEAVALAKGYAAQDNEMVRAAAAEAVRRVPSTEADQFLAEAITTDGHDFVRTQAVRAFSDRPVTEGAVQLLADVARNDASVVTREAALSVLARYATDHPELSAIVKELTEQSSGS